MNRAATSTIVGEMSPDVGEAARYLEERRIERLGGNESMPVDVRCRRNRRPSGVEDANVLPRGSFSLRVVTIDIAPLHERQEDIPMMADTFLRFAAERYKLPQQSLSRALKRLVGYNWLMSIIKEHHRSGSDHGRRRDSGA